jgi:hypothetical protein
MHIETVLNIPYNTVFFRETSNKLLYNLTSQFDSHVVTGGVTKLESAVGSPGGHC